LDNTSRIEEDLDEAVYAGADAFPRFDSSKWQYRDWVDGPGQPGPFCMFRL